VTPDPVLGAHQEVRPPRPALHELPDGAGVVGGLQAAAVRGAPRPREPERGAALDLRPPPVSAGRCAASAAATWWPPRPQPRRRLPRRARAGGRARRGEAARPPRLHPAPLGRRHAHLPRREAARPLPRESSPATSSSRRTGRRRSRHRPRHHHPLADPAALAGMGFNRISMGVQDFDAQGAGGGRAHPGLRRHPRPRPGRPRAGLRRREPRPHLRAALPDPRDLEADARPDPRRSTPTGWPSSASPTCPGRSRTSGSCRRRRCPRPSSGWSCSCRRRDVREGGLPLSRPRPLRARVGPSSRGPRTRATCTELPGLHDPSRPGHGRLRDDLDLGHRRGGLRHQERAQAQGLERAGARGRDPVEARRVG